MAKPRKSFRRRVEYELDIQWCSLTDLFLDSSIDPIYLQGAMDTVWMLERDLLLREA